MDRLTAAVRAWLDPKVGAAAIFRSLQTRKAGLGWAEKFFGSASWLLIVSTALVVWLPWPGKVPMETGPINWVLGIYTVYVLIFLEVGSRIFSQHYDRLFFRLLRITANIIVGSALIWFNAGGRSYFWFFYSLPILQAVIYLRPLCVLLVTAGSVGLYWMVSSIVASRLARLPDFALLIMNSLILSVATFLVYQLFEAAKESRKVEHFEALQAVKKIAPAVDTETGFDDLLEMVIEAAVKATRASSGSIMLFDKKTNALKIRVRYPLTRPWWKKAREFELGEGIAGWVVEHKEPYLCLDATQDWRFAPAIPMGSIKSLLVVPIVGHGCVLGVINVDSPEANLFDDNDVQLLLAFASYVGDRIDRAKLLDALFALEQSISLELPEALRIILERLETVTGYDSAAIFLVEGGRAKVVAAQGFPDEQMARKVSFALADDALFQELSRTKRILVLRDVWKDKRFRALGGTEYVRGWLGTPLVVGGEVIGFLTLDSRNVGHFNQVDAELVAVFARHAALAIENARRADELERLMASAIDAIIVVDEQGKVVRFNQQAEKILGYGEEVLGQPVGPLYYDPKEAQRVKRLLLESKDGRITDYDTFVRSKDGERIPIRLSAFLSFDYEGKQAGSVGFFRDLREIESARRQIKQLTDLLEAGQAITELRDLQAVLETIVDKTMEALRADVVSLYSYDHEQDKIHVPPLRRGLRYEEAASLDMGSDSIVRKVIRYGKVHFADNAQTDSLVSGDFVSREGIQSCAACPLKAGDIITGVMFCNYREPHPFSDEEKAVIRLFANEAAIAIENALLYEETRRIFESEQRRAEHLAAIHNVSMAANSALDLNEMLGRALAEMIKVFDLEQGGVVIFDPQEGYGHTVAEYPQIREPKIPILLEGNASMEWILTHKRPMVIEDAPHDARLDSIRGAVEQWGVKSMLLVPLVVRNEVIGTVGLDAIHARREFTEEEVELAQIMANQVGTAIENLRSQEEVNAIQTVNSAFMLLSRWAHKVRQKSFALQKDLDSLEKDLPVGLFDEILKGMSESVQELSLPAQTILADAEDGLERTVDMGQLLVDVTSRLCRNRKALIDLELNMDDAQCFVTGTPLLLQIAVEMLIENAVESMEQKGEPGRLEVECCILNDIVRARISDTGSGIPPEVLKDLFHRRVASDRGFGYGSFTVASILRAHKGAIHVVRTGVKGTLVEFWLPVAKG